MKIVDPLIAPFVIDMDESGCSIVENVVISKKGSERLGEEREKIIGHYSNLSTALLKIAKLKTLEEFEECTILEFMTKFDEISSKMLSLKV